jgi:hypothetical protein
MTLTQVSRLGPYEITSALGVDGMGEVYRGHDTKLNRDVAIKVLLPSVANDPDRLARFSREAQVLASLNHPYIAQIHGLEDANGVRALVMELVEGPTLADRITTGPIPLAEALPIARQIAEALETAHEHGIIHRDLKPTVCPSGGGFLVVGIRASPPRRQALTGPSSGLGPLHIRGVEGYLGALPVAKPVPDGPPISNRPALNRFRRRAISL